MKNFNDLVPLNKIDINIGSVDKEQIDIFVYNRLFEDIMNKYIYSGEDAKEYNILDVFCTQSHIKDCLSDKQNVKYTGLDIISEPEKEGGFSKPDIVCDVNKMPVKDDTYDLIFSRGDRLGYGKNHGSLFEIERVLKTNGYLIVSLSRFWFNIGFNQMLFCYRDWRYLEAIEIGYSFEVEDADKKKNIITTSKYFLVYKFYGK